jgi:hypothetical protein
MHTECNALSFSSHIAGELMDMAHPIFVPILTPLWVQLGLESSDVPSVLLS